MVYNTWIISNNIVYLWFIIPESDQIIVHDHQPLLVGISKNLSISI
jgi:hypothetical protein